MEYAITGNMPSASREALPESSPSRGQTGISKASAQKTDDAKFSAAGRGKADFSSPVWSPRGQSAFSMSSYTAQGTLVTLSGGEQGGGTFSMGKFAPKTMFRLSGQADSPALSITFESASGWTQSFALDGSARFVQLESGEIMRDDAGTSLKRLDGSDNDAIIVNLDEGATARGGSGNDIIFNLARNAALDGGDGNDVLMSMGDGSSLLGGNGDDLLKVTRDVLRRSDVSEGLGMSDSKAALIGFEKGHSVVMDGGDGNDSLIADVKLHDSRISGGNGDDSLDFDVLVNSKLDAGAGRDRISVKTAYASSLKGGDGDDSFTVGTASHSSSIEGGAGNDVISASRLLDQSAIRGGDGDDSIEVGLSDTSLIEGGAGNDFIHVRQARNSAIRGGEGDDSIWVEEARNSVVDGGRGNDVIRAEKALNSLITGGEGDDDISVAGTSNLVDGGKGDDALTVRGSAFVMDDSQLISNNMDAKELENMVDAMRNVLNQLPLVGPDRQRYEAALRYAKESRRA